MAAQRPQTQQDDTGKPHTPLTASSGLRVPFLNKFRTDCCVFTGVCVVAFAVVQLMLSLCNPGLLMVDRQRNTRTKQHSAGVSSAAFSPVC